MSEQDLSKDLNKIPDELATFTGATEGSVPTAAPVEGAGKKGRTRKKKEPKEPKAPRDNIGRIQGMTQIGNVRKAVQIAIAKKAKAAGKPEPTARYEKEIEAGKIKLAELLAANTSTKDLLAAGEEPNRVITHFISDVEDDYSTWLEAHNYKASKRMLKTLSDEIPASFFKELEIELHDILATRHEKSDFRLRAACKSANLMAMVAAGQLKYEGGKWVDATGKVVGGEAAVDQALAGSPKA